MHEIVLAISDDNGLYYGKFPCCCYVSLYLVTVTADLIGFWVLPDLGVAVEADQSILGSKSSGMSGYWP